VTTPRRLGVALAAVVMGLLVTVTRFVDLVEE
jgi:hypothetical protein